MFDSHEHEITRLVSCEQGLSLQGRMQDSSSPQEGQPDPTAAKRSLLTQPGLCLFKEIFQLPELAVLHEKTSHSPRDSPTNKASDKAGHKHFTLCLHFEPGWAVPVGALGKQ